MRGWGRRRAGGHAIRMGVAALLVSVAIGGPATAQPSLGGGCSTGTQGVCTWKVTRDSNVLFVLASTTGWDVIVEGPFGGVSVCAAGGTGASVTMCTIPGGSFVTIFVGQGLGFGHEASLQLH